MTSPSRAFALLFAACASFAAWAGPGEDATKLVQRWATLYSANNVNALVDLYATDAVLFGTSSPVISEGSDAIHAYFGALKGSGNKNTVRSMRVMVITDDAVMVTGFYDFSNATRSPPTVRPARYTMLITRRDVADWKIAHHHSSPLVPAPPAAPASR